MGSKEVRNSRHAHFGTVANRRYVTVESPHELLDKYKIEHSGISAVPFVYPLVN